MPIDIPEINNIPKSSIGGFRAQVIVGNLDISDYVLSGQITRTLENPVGTFTLHLRPIVREKLMRGLPIQMNDYAEIRLERTNQNGATMKVSPEIRVAMRGFVDNEEFQEHASNNMDGSLIRSYTLSGSDLGKMMARRLVFVPSSIDLRPSVATGVAEQWIESMNWVLETDAGVDTTGVYRPLSTWAKFFVLSVYKGELEKMINKTKHLRMNSDGQWVESNNSTPDFEFTVKTDLPLLGSNSAEKIWVSTQPLLNALKGNQSTSFWNMLTFYCIKPFIEMFFTEDNNTTQLNIRWSPLRRREKSGNDFIHLFPTQYTSGDQQPWFSGSLTRRTISSLQVLSKQIRRQEMDRCTYFHTRPQSNMNDLTAGQSRVNGVQNVRGSNPYMDAPGLYQFGIRSLSLELPWFPMRIRQYNNPEDNTGGSGKGFAGGTVVTDFIESCRDFTTWLVDTMSFTDTLYSGYITILGNTDIQLGEEIYIVDTGELYYIESIDHSWEVYPNVQFLTRLGVSRGVWPADLTAPTDNFGIVGNRTQQSTEDGNTKWVVERSVVGFS